MTKLFGPFRLNGSSIHPLHPVLSKDHQVKETRCTQHVAAAAKSKKKKKTVHSFNFPAQLDLFFLGSFIKSNQILYY